MYYKHNPKLTGNAKVLRKNMTKEERHLWYDFLKDYPVRVLRQKVIDRYIVDFYCSAARIAIELDGSQHFEPSNRQEDLLRDMHLREREIHVLRIPNHEINQNFTAVCEYIHAEIQKRISDK